MSNRSHPPSPLGLSFPIWAKEGAESADLGGPSLFTSGT